MKNQRLLAFLIIAAVLGSITLVLPFVAPTLVSEPTKEEAAGVRYISVSGQRVRAEIANTDEARAKGLSGRDGLAQNEGMLFIFGADGRHAFWMKDMKFSIDMLWLTSEGKVVHIQPSVSPDTFPATFQSDVDARYVLELAAGFAQKHDISVGDVVEL